MIASFLLSRYCYLSAVRDFLWCHDEGIFIEIEANQGAKTSRRDHKKVGNKKGGYQN
jgi:hypothetical protein